ncbi:sigma-70 family RNA polymerase sigma factor [Algoriphagus sp. CAU 1675]|uniref:RNA polymerase sigma factor n=1 Tax=Algoriphagus sp. CAU 1675 TaxID=3032597 RepID=UPI0023DC33B5|nr:sigma-70 family RNA polymerase sigma factor [Algoriphagus sp. CAU 1675]MDF2157426.1 sigma-70 family RNA polymerase sigma factor [Algoriphagus sp. CAU 1675]
MHFQEDDFYIQQTLSGEMGAFGQLVQKHQKFAYTLALRILKNSEEAEEATQDAFFKLFHSLGSFEGKSKFKTWLYKIVYHEALGRLRKKKDSHIQLDDITEFESLNTDFENGIEAMQSQDRTKLIKYALDQMKSTEAAVITLFYLEEYSIKEITEITTQTEANVKILLHRGRKNMLHILQKNIKKELIHLL